jgi:peptidoglycan hydrolase-like protein with peptidoglycan-binding domain
MLRATMLRNRAGKLAAASVWAFLFLGAWGIASATDGNSTKPATSATAAAKPATPAPAKSASTKKPVKRPVARNLPQPAPTRDRIVEIQSALGKAGFYQGMPTGSWDAATIDGMTRFQTANNLPPSGKITALSLEKLGLGSDTAGHGAPVPASPASAGPIAPITPATP